MRIVIAQNFLYPTLLSQLKSDHFGETHVSSYTMARLKRMENYGYQTLYLDMRTVIW